MSLSQRRRRLLVRLRGRRGREREGLVLVEGVRASMEALAAGASVRFAVAAPGLERMRGGGDALAALAGSGIEMEEVGEAELASLADTRHPQGLLLVCVEPASGERIVRSGGRYLVLDAVQDPGNVGTLVRCATAFAVDATLVLDGTADPWGAKAVRASAGMVFRQPLGLLDADAAVAALSAAQVPLMVADAGGVDVAEAVPTGGWALAVANEGAGARPSLTSAAVRRVSVPMPGPAESLNAAVAGAVLMYALTVEAARADR